MIDYDPDQLKQIQEYRAVCEYVPSTGRTQIINPHIASLPQQVLDLVVDHFHPQRNIDLTDHSSTTTDLIEAYDTLLADDTDAASSPYPVTYEIIRGETNPTQDPLLTQLALNELAPFESHSMFERMIAKSALDTMEQGHKQTATARLSRISEQDTPTLFEKATRTETAYGFSNESLGNSKLVSKAGVGVALNGLVGVIEEMGGDAEEMLPDSLFNRPIASPDGDPLGEVTEDGLKTLSGDQTVAVDNAMTTSDLMDSHTETTEGLREQIKYIRDCVYLESLHDRFTDFFDTPNTPDLIWKQAALDIQNGDSPLDIERSDDEDRPSAPTEKLLKQTTGSQPTSEQQDSTDQASSDGDTADSSTTTDSSQAGLTQFG